MFLPDHRGNLQIWCFSNLQGPQPVSVSVNAEVTGMLRCLRSPEQHLLKAIQVLLSHQTYFTDKETKAGRHTCGQASGASMMGHVFMHKYIHVHMQISGSNGPN